MRGSHFKELTAFVTIAQERSFRRAAVRLGVSPSALSHTMRELEERLGVRLLNRTTRSVSTTEAGLALLDRLEPAFAEVESAVQAVETFHGRPSGRLRLNLPRVAASLALTPVLGRFVQAYPDIELDLVLDDGLTDIVAEGFDAGIRQGERLHRDMVAVRVTPDIRPAVIGSPEYFAQHGRPSTPQELTGHSGINYRWAKSGALFQWAFEGPDGPVLLSVEGAITVNDTDIILSAALQGVGLAYLAEDYVASHLESGKLERVMDDWCKPLSGCFLYYPSGRYMTSALRALIDFIKISAPSAAY